MSKRLLFLMVSLSSVLALVLSSCQKDGVFKSEQQTDAKSTQSSPELTNIQKLGKKDFSSIINAARPKFDLLYIFLKFRGYDNEKRLIAARFRSLAPAISESNKYYVELNNYYETSNNVFEVIHVGRMMILDDDYNRLSGSFELEYDDLFTDKGTGNGELRFYLVRKVNFVTMRLQLASLKYTQATKPKFDDYTFPEGYDGT
ncbi:MAG: hypothetical protein ACQPRI_04830 [Solitalea-like symbiont of Tyrophagus putrescentiae]